MSHKFLQNVAFKLLFTTTDFVLSVLTKHLIEKLWSVMSGEGV